MVVRPGRRAALYSAVERCSAGQRPAHRHCLTAAEALTRAHRRGECSHSAISRRLRQPLFRRESARSNLLEGIARTGSLSQAAREMRMSYRRAWLLLEDMNLSFDQPVARRQRRGPRRRRRGPDPVRDPLGGGLSPPGIQPAAPCRRLLGGRRPAHQSRQRQATIRSASIKRKTASRARIGAAERSARRLGFKALRCSSSETRSCRRPPASWSWRSLRQAVRLACFAAASSTGAAAGTVAVAAAGLRSRRCGGRCRHIRAPRRRRRGKSAGNG